MVTGAGWNFYHWMFETVPYIGLYEKIGCRGKIPLYFPFPLKAWHWETLELLGFDKADVLPYQGHNTLFKQCIFPTHSSRDLIPSPSVIHFLRDKLAKPRDVTPGKRVFLTRGGVRAVRGMLNGPDVSRWMSENGFVFVNPASMSIREQIELFSDVEMVAAEGGAALSNLIFCPVETKVLVMAASRTWAETFSAIAGELGQELVAVLGDCRCLPKPYYIWSAFDFTIDPKDLDVGFRQLMEKAH
jgi:capsular polysaccharide biosynthesis protein